MRTMMPVCFRFLFFFLVVAAEKQEFVYMDTEAACGKDVHLTDYSLYTVQAHPNAKIGDNVTGYFPCYHKFYSNNAVVCIQQHVIHFYDVNCTTKLNYYTFESDVHVSDLATKTPDRTIDCDNYKDMNDEWCSREPTNVMILLEETEPNTKLQDLYFILEVAKISSTVRRSNADFQYWKSNRHAVCRTAMFGRQNILKQSWMFFDCGSKHYLKHSSIYINLFAGDEDSCVKTFTYYDQADQHNSRICLKFIRWSENRQCSSFHLRVLNNSNEHGLMKHYKCSDPKPDILCTDGPSMTLKVIRTGDLKDEKEDFSLKIWDSYSESDEPQSKAMSTNTIMIIVCVVIGVFIILIIICALCRGGCRGTTGPVMCTNISLPSLPSFPSLPSVVSLPSFDND